MKRQRIASFILGFNCFFFKYIIKIQLSKMSYWLLAHYEIVEYN